MIKVSEMKIKSKVDWNSINWRKIQLRVWRIQKKIYDCSRQSEKFDVIKRLRREEPCEGEPSRTVLNQG